MQSAIPEERPSGDIVVPGGQLTSLMRRRTLVSAPERTPVEPPSGFSEYWPVIRRHYGFVVVAALLCGLAAYFVTTVEHRTYMAHAAVEIQSINESFLNIQNLSPTVPSGGAYNQEYDIQTAIRGLRSRTVLANAIAKDTIRPRLVKAESQGRIPLWREVYAAFHPTGDTRTSAPPTEDELIDAVSGSLKVQAQANSRVVDLTLTSTDPQLAADLLNNITVSYSELSLQKRWDTIQSVGGWLATQMHDLKAKLDQSEAEMQKYAEASNLVVTSETGNVEEQRVRQLQEELVRAQTDRIAKQARYELALSAPSDSLPEVLDNAALRDSQLELTRLRQQLAELSTSFTGAYPKVLKLKAQIASLEQARDKERANITGRIQLEFDAAKRREAILSGDYAVQARQLTSQSLKVAQYNLLKHEIDTTRALYDAMGQRVREAGLSSAIRANNVQIMDAAAAPSAPYRPSKIINTGLGLGSGMLFGLISILWYDRKTRATQRPGDIYNYLKVAELAIVPVEPTKSNWPWRRRSLPAFKQGSSTVVLGGAVEMAALNDRSPALADSFRSALVSIMDKQNGSWPGIVVISSALPGEGKTTVASNLAIILAQTNRRVLLIDGDLRRPRLHQVFGVSNQTGFSDVIAGTGSFNIYSTCVPRLSLLPSGSKCNPDALFRPIVPTLLRRFRKEYDVVLIDTPPLLQLPDARVIGKHSDGIILTVDAQTSPREKVAMAACLIYDDRIPLLGTILNKHLPHTSEHSYNYRAEHRGEASET